jgi:hypothetical protein
LKEYALEYSLNDTLNSNATELAAFLDSVREDLAGFFGVPVDQVGVQAF